MFCQTSHLKADGISEIILQNIDCSVSELHVLLRILQNISHCCLIINGSCSINQDEIEILAEPRMHLQSLIVKASMSTQTLSNLLEPLVISEVKLQDCTIVDKDEEDNLLPEAIQVICNCLCELFSHCVFKYKITLNILSSCYIVTDGYNVS